ncbi:MAG: hypothetical protein V1678_01525 [Candidatus Aenigmatarchaeota archaeon]
MKGIHPLLSHTILLALGLTAMGLITFSVSMSLNGTERNLVFTELRFFANSAKDSVIEAYALANQSSNYTTGLFQLNLPEKIGNKKYSITLKDGELMANMTVRGEPLGVVLGMPIDAKMNGTRFMPSSILLEKKDGKISIGLVE